MSDDNDHQVVTRIFNMLADTPDNPRPHLGASLIGHPCDRYLWLTFRWAIAPNFPGRIRRLFRRGNGEEDFVIKELRDIGIKVYDRDPSTGRQFAIAHGHFGGSMDGVIRGSLDGLSDGTGYVLEIKTHSEKSFNDMKKHGVYKSKYQHWAQMQCYMHSAKIDQAMYFAVCKNDDRLYVEVIKHDDLEAEKLFAKAQRIIAEDRLPQPLSSDPSWYQCKMCNFHAFCHKSKIAREVNCRTCANATAKDNGTWHCQRWDDVIPSMDAQQAGCADHVIHPDLVPWPMTPGEDGMSVTYSIEDTPYQNGHGGWTSRDLLNHYDTQIEPEPLLSAVMEAFPNAEIIKSEAG